MEGIGSKCFLSSPLLRTRLGANHIGCDSSQAVQGHSWFERSRTHLSKQESEGFLQGTGTNLGFAGTERTLKSLMCDQVTKPWEARDGNRLAQGLAASRGGIGAACQAANGGGHSLPCGL